MDIQPADPTLRVASAEDDYRLMLGVHKGEETSLKLLYQKHSGLVYAVCLKILRNKELAEEVLVDVFFELWRRRDRYDATRGSPLTYLTTLARSRAIDRYRSTKERGNVTLDEALSVAWPSEAGDLPGGKLEIEERAVLVRQAITQLDVDLRSAIELAYYQGLSHSEIAEKLGKPLGTVKTHVRQGLIRLRESLRNRV